MTTIPFTAKLRLTAKLRRIPFVIRHSYFVILLLLSACGQPSASGNKAAWPGPFDAATPTAVAPQPIAFPRDEAAHKSLTEWWYYTGHLEAEDGARYGFESVIFQAIRSNIPPYFAAHAAITDHQRKEFRYDQRTQQTDANQLGAETAKGFDFRMGDWRWQGLDGTDRIEATAPGYALNLTMTAVKPPAQHEGGYIDYGPAGSTYYYSRTRMTISGTIDDNGVRKNVTGAAWFDHQWGNFLTATSGGWDWFSAHLDDGSDFTVYLIRGEGQQLLGSFGTYIAADGKVTGIPSAEIKVDVLNRWTSPRTGVTYPSGWRVTLPTYGLDLTWEPIIQDQELDTRQSTTNIYWEGEVKITGTQGGKAHGGVYMDTTGGESPAKRPKTNTVRPSSGLHALLERADDTPPLVGKAIEASQQVIAWKEDSMAERHTRPGSLLVEGDQPLIALPLEEDGREVERYFVEETAVEGTGSARSIAEALRLGGAWSDLDWGEMERELYRIGHGNPPTPPIDEL